MILIGKVKITKLKGVTPKMGAGVIYKSNKVGIDAEGKKSDNEWETTFIDCKIVGDAYKELSGNISDKDTIEIEYGFLETTRLWSKKESKPFTKLQAVIMKAHKVTNEEYGMTPVDDGELPF